MNAQSFIAFYPTRDLRACRAFYETVVGLPVYRDQGACVIYRVSEGGYLGFCAHKTPPDRPEALFITLIVEDVDAVCARLVRAGAEPIKPPSENARFRVYQALFLDPDGYTLEIQRFLD